MHSRARGGRAARPHSPDVNHFKQCPLHLLLVLTMATQRVTKSSQQENGQAANGSDSSKLSVIQNRQAKKQKLLQKQRFQGRLRWTAAGVLLLVAALTFYYYYTNYHSDSSSSPSSRRTASSIKEKPAKDKSTTAKDKSTTAKAKRSTSKGKKASQSTSKKKAGKKKTPAMEDFEKLQNRLLRQPIPASDVDRPHVLDIITADNLIVAKKYEEALERFNAILKQFPQSPRAQFGKGITLSYLAEVKQSNKLMDSAINFFKMAGESIVASDLIKVPSLAAMADKAQSRGNYQLATEGMEKLVALKPDSAVYANQLGVLYLTIGKTKKAKNYFKKCIKKSEDNHFASAQLGAILLEERQYEKSLPLLMDGIRKDPDIKTNARFYNYAGEALTKLNRSHEAQVIYGEAVSVGVFPSVWQRPIVTEPGLTALPWWSADKTGYITDLTRIEKKMDVIISEARALFDADKLVFSSDKSSPHFVLYTRGKKNARNCGRTPRTCALIETFPEAAGCSHGTVKFSSLPGHTHISPHVGRTNTKLQVWVGLHVAEPGGIRIRVAEDIKILGNKQIGILDESFEKEVWHEGEEPALYMTIDVWHPDLHHDARRL